MLAQFMMNADIFYQIDYLLQAWKHTSIFHRTYHVLNSGGLKPSGIRSNVFWWVVPEDHISQDFIPQYHRCEEHRFKKLAMYLVLKLLVDVTAFIMALSVVTWTELWGPMLLDLKRICKLSLSPPSGWLFSENSVLI